MLLSTASKKPTFYEMGRRRASWHYRRMILPNCGRPSKTVRSCGVRSVPTNQESIDNLAAFNPIAHKLLYAQGAPLRHIPLKVYLPSSPTASEPASGHLRVVQSLIAPTIVGSREPQTLGTALHGLLPALFPSRRTPILAKPVLHGSVVPMGAPMEELLKSVAYLDGWLHLGIVVMS